MIERRYIHRWLHVSVGLALLVACGEDRGSEAGGTGNPATASVGTHVDAALSSRLEEVYDQLEAGDWRPYLALRAEVNTGALAAELDVVMRAGSAVTSRMAATVLEDRLVTGEMSDTVTASARDVLTVVLSADDTRILVPLATRILGRLPRGTSQTALFAALEVETDGVLRDMTIAALGDNADADGIATLQSQYVGLARCSEARHATLAIRRADDALAAPAHRAWLSDVASSRMLGCADALAEAGESPDPALLALIAAHEQSVAHTLVQEVLLSEVGRALKVRALAMLLESGDPTAGTALNESLKDLAAQGLASEASAVINALRGL